MIHMDTSVPSVPDAPYARSPPPPPPSLPTQGLGKTVEVLALILSAPAPASLVRGGPHPDCRSRLASHATLVSNQLHILRTLCGRI